MSENGPRFWDKVRPVFHEFFQFWPDHEDLLWAKSVWPIMEDAGLYADCDDDADAWTRRHILALAILYAESAWRFGTPDYQPFDKIERGWLTLAFGSRNNLDETLWDVGRALADHHQIDHWSEGNAGLFLPLIRSFVTGSGFYHEGPELADYLQRVWARHPDMCEFREDELHRMWVGGHFESGGMTCFF
jgi:hypothetical protein